MRKAHRHLNTILFCFFVLALWPVYALDESRPNLLLANVYEQDVEVGDYWISEKYDGVRAYWNGQQFLSRKGNVYHAPKWFTHGFPQQPLDGELWIGRGQFEDLLGTVRKEKPVDSEWQQVRYMVFELPDAPGTFSQRLLELQDLIAAHPNPQLHLAPQFRLQNHQQLQDKLTEIIELGGEGLMMHRADALYSTGRSDDLLKVKNYQDSEATVLAHLPGKGKYAGMLGSLLVENTHGKRFKIGSGFSDAERLAPPPPGTIITYKYYGLTKTGIPRFASFLRIRKAP